MHKQRLSYAGTACLMLGAIVLGARVANAETLDDLSDSNFQPVYGDYAPAGDCSRMPKVTIEASGLVFRTDEGSQRATRIEYALSYFGPDYQGISLALFPFPRSEDEPGHILMYVNPDEIAGRLTFEQNLGPGERLSALEARLVNASPLLRCKSV